MATGAFKPIFIAGGIFFLITLAILFYPSIVGNASSGSDISKYNGHSESGNRTSATVAKYENLFVGVYSMSPVGFMLFGIMIFLLVIFVMYKLVINKKMKSKRYA